MIELYLRVIVDLAMFFGLYVITAIALNFQYGNAGVPNMGCAVSVSIGGFTVSMIVTRIVFWMGEQVGIAILPHTSNYDWIYNNQLNVSMMNDFLQKNTFLSVAFFIFSIALGFVFGWAFGYIISLPAIRLKATYLIITLTTLCDSVQIISRNIVPITGGTLGIYVPDLFAWFSGERGIIMVMITLFIGLFGFFIFKTMIDSPYGRLMRAVRENPDTVNSVGKDVTTIRRNVLMFASGMTAVVGVLITYYYSFCIGSNFLRATWTYWPWLMLMVGGPGNNTGTLLGCTLITAMRRLITLFKWQIESLLFYPIALFENQLLGVILLAVLIFRPNGLMPEKSLNLPGINYKQLITEITDVDWRVIRKAPSTKKIQTMFKNFLHRFKFWEKKK
jgi:branched-chain amino acid transport system permease protein